jgi:hypothetical protein
MMGQQRGIIDSANIMSTPLQQRMETLQNQRAARADIIRSAMGFETEAMNRADRLNESKRAFDFQREQFEYGKTQDALQMALARQKASGSGGATKQDVISKLASTMKRGEDGYASPQAYNEAKTEWADNAGFSPAEFDELFGDRINPIYSDSNWYSWAKEQGIPQYRYKEPK